jgi:glycosyltransferase involved in cell wall biosynthesis
MRTLFATVDPAFPPISGVDLRAWQNAEAASELGPVLLASIGSPGPGIPPAGIEIRHITGMKTSEVWRSDFDVTFSVEMIEHFCSMAANFRPDAIVLESLPLTNLASVAKDCTRALIVDLHNIESDLVAQEFQVARDANTRCAIDARVRRIRSIEQRAAALADAIWVCSSIDRDRLVNDGGSCKAIYVVPNGVPRPNSRQDRPPNNGFGSCPTLLFIGHLGYPPNIEAALLLIKLMPALWERIPGARLILAGRDPHPLISSRSQPGRIDVIANPSSTSPLLLAAHIAVMPLQRGGGTRIKALEAMYWGLPVVATARAVEGLHLEDGVNVRLAETAKEFVAAVCALRENPARYESQRIAAQRHVMENFGPAVIRAAAQAGLRLGLHGEGR